MDYSEDCPSCGEPCDWADVTVSISPEEPATRDYAGSPSETEITGDDPITCSCGTVVTPDPERITEKYLAGLPDGDEDDEYEDDDDDPRYEAWIDRGPFV